MTYYPQDPAYGQPPRPPQGYDPLYNLKRRMQGWWLMTAVLTVIGIGISAAHRATLVPHDNPYIDTLQPTTLTYVLLIVGLVNGVVGTVALVIAIRSTGDYTRAKRETYRRY